MSVCPLGCSGLALTQLLAILIQAHTPILSELISMDILFSSITPYFHQLYHNVAATWI